MSDFNRFLPSRQQSGSGRPSLPRKRELAERSGGVQANCERGIEKGVKFWQPETAPRVRPSVRPFGDFLRLRDKQDRRVDGWISSINPRHNCSASRQLASLPPSFPRTSLIAGPLLHASGAQFIHPSVTEPESLLRLFCPNAASKLPFCE